MFLKSESTITRPFEDKCFVMYLIHCHEYLEIAKYIFYVLSTWWKGAVSKEYIQQTYCWRLKKAGAHLRYFTMSISENQIHAHIWLNITTDSDSSFTKLSHLAILLRFTSSWQKPWGVESSKEPCNCNIREVWMQMLTPLCSMFLGIWCFHSLHNCYSYHFR